jgi:hypothetical protein
MKLQKLHDKFYKTNKCFALFESRDDLLQELDELAKDLRIPIMVVGGSALPKYNYNRTTEDIDIVVAASDISKLIHALLKRGLKPMGKYNKLIHDSGMMLDVNIPGPNFPEPESNRAGVTHASLPLLLALKIKTGRLRDISDVVELIKRNNLPLEYIQKKIWPYLDVSNKEKSEKLWKDTQTEIKEEKAFWDQQPKLF